MKSFVVRSGLVFTSPLNPHGRMDVPFLRLVSFLDGSREEEDMIGMVRAMTAKESGIANRKYHELLNDLQEASDRLHAKEILFYWLKLADAPSSSSQRNRDMERMESIGERWDMLLDALLWEIEGKLELEKDLALKKFEMFRTRVGNTSGGIKS